MNTYRSSDDTRNLFINIEGRLYSVHLLKCMTRRLFDIDVYSWNEADYILQWLEEFENGGAMPSEWYFRCPHGHEVKFLDCLLCIWLTFNSLEDDVHVVETDEDAEILAEMWHNYHLRCNDIGDWTP